MDKKDALLSLKSDDLLIRCDAIEYLGRNISSPEDIEVIVRCFWDKNYLVRCEAYDAMYECNNENVYNSLIKRLSQERSKCARMHLCSSLCSIIKKQKYTKNDINQILKCYQKEEDLNVLLSYWCILYVLFKDKKYIDNILSCLENEDYHIRCNVINLLYDIEDDVVKQYERIAFSKQLGIERSKAVKMLLEDTLNRIG